MKLVIKTMEGLEEVLKEELEELHLQNIKLLKRGVECEGNWAQLYKCNYLLRTAIRVLVPIASFEIESQEAFYEALRTIDWSRYIDDGQTFAVRSTVFGELFSNSLFVTYRCKDAIVDQLSEEKNYRPNVELENPDIVVNIHLHMNKLSVALDSSGRSLHLRNYKQRSYKAPLNETFAAGIIKLAKWDKKQTFYDPMCGSGTFTTEALMSAANIPAGIFIEKFSFENWPEFHPDIWQSVKEAGQAAMHPPEGEIITSDIHSYAVRDLRKNLQKLPYRKLITIKEEDFLKSKGDSKGIIFLNPPYDKRVKVRNVTQFYRTISDHLKQNWQGSSVWILSGNGQAMKSFGLKHSAKLTLDNGGIPTKLYNFELYAGSKKAKFKDDRVRKKYEKPKDTKEKPYNKPKPNKDRRPKHDDNYEKQKPEKPKVEPKPEKGNDDRPRMYRPR